MAGLIHGEYVFRKRLGRVAWFCPICGDVQAFRLIARRRVRHWYFVPTGSPLSERWELFCEECGFACATDELDWIAIEPGDALPLPALIARTNPHIREKTSEQLDSAAGVRSRRPTPRQKDYFIRMVLISAGVANEVRASIADLWLGRVALWGGCLVFVGGVFLAGIQPTPPERRNGMILATITTGVFLACCGLAWPIVRQRIALRYVVPLLARGLRFVRTSEEELAELLGRLRRSGLRLPRSVTPARILAADSATAGIR